MRHVMLTSTRDYKPFTLDHTIQLKCILYYFTFNYGLISEA